MDNTDDLMYEDYESEDYSESTDSLDSILNDLTSFNEMPDNTLFEAPTEDIDPIGNTSFLSSRISKPKENTKEKEAEDTDWFRKVVQDIDDAEMGIKKSRRRKGTVDDFFEGNGKKKKKKKKKADGEPTDFKKEFEPESALYTTILRDTTRFVSSLQAEYDAIVGKKVAGRGMTKYTQDLISNITSGRQLAMSLVEKRVNLKKLIAELAAKERKELGIGENDSGNLGEFGSNYLKKLIDERKMFYEGRSDEVVDMTEHEVGDLLDNRLDDADETMFAFDDDRTEESETYLRYENDNVQVKVSISESNPDDYFYFAENGNGEQVEDYPLPITQIDKSKINRSTGVATDELGQKYSVEWRP